MAASGTTPFTLGCLREAGSRGALTVGIANNPNTPILDESDHPIRLDTGPEPIAGSTRMKAGTAQRVALTLLSSLVMIRLGHVYQGLMVDVQATNSKLVRRSEAMVAQLTGHGRDRVREALREADGSVKLALLLLEGVGIDEARAALDRGGGDLRAAKSAIESDGIRKGGRRRLTRRVMRRQLLSAGLDRIGVDQDKGENARLGAGIDPGVHRAALHDDIARFHRYGLAVVEFEVAFAL